MVLSKEWCQIQASYQTSSSSPPFLYYLAACCLKFKIRETKKYYFSAHCAHLHVCSQTTIRAVNKGGLPDCFYSSAGAGGGGPLENGEIEKTTIFFSST